LPLPVFCPTIPGMNKQAAYDLGFRLAMNAVFGEPRGLTKIALNSEQYTFLEKLLGRNVSEVSARELERIMQSGELGAITDSFGPQRMNAVRSYIKNLLHGTGDDLPLTREIVGRGDPNDIATLKKQIDVSDSIREGRRVLAPELSAAQNARLLAAGIGIGGPLAIHQMDATDQAKKMAPAAAGLGIAALPMIQGFQSGALRIPKSLAEITGTEAVGDINELAAKIQRGDVILTGDPTMRGSKAQIIAAGADPHAYHSAIATGPIENGRLNVVHGAGDIGGATHGSYPIGDRDIVVRRFKDPKHTEQFMKNIDEVASREGVVSSLFGREARTKLYDMPGAIGSAVKDLLPESVRKAFGQRNRPSTSFCTSLVGGASPTCLKPGVPGSEVLPHHIESSEALHDVGKFFTKRTPGVAASETALRAVPLALRGALGAGLGYGAYRGIKALTDDTPKPIKDIKSWFGQ